jgi:hypothetical protein
MRLKESPSLMVRTWVNPAEIEIEDKRFAGPGEF